jgi:acetyl-CoA decarbonylase/synthase complex subunit epsilon
MSCEPWQCAEVAATKKAMSITKPEVAVSLIKRATRPILIVGSGAVERELEGRLLIDYLIDFANASKVPVVATAHIVGEFMKRGFKPSGLGLDGKGPYDVILFVALPYYMEANILSGLMHFAPKLKTITLDNAFHPHASWSFPNSNVKIWIENLKVMTSKFEGGQ